MTNSKTYIQEQLKELNIQPIKHLDKLSHLTADYIELKALFSSDMLSLNDILNSFRKEGVQISKASKNEDIGLTEAENNDNDEIWIKEKFQICENRKDFLSENYPFLLEETSICVKDKLSEKQELYLLLLLSANLNYFPKYKPKLTTDFERVSFEALKNYLPDYAITKQFGKNSDYSGNAKEKIEKLAKDLNIRCDLEEIDDNATGNQERGLDIIGWIPFNDNIPNLVTILGQCACGKEWYNKKGETKRYEQYYRFKGQNPIHSMFIPYGLIKSSSSFYQSDEVDCLLFERFRIMENLNDITFYNELESKEIIQKCVLYG